MKDYGSIRHFRQPDRGFTRVPNSLIVADISANAYRVASYLMSHQDGYRVTNVQISEAVHVSLRTVVTVLAELEDRRYLVRSPLHVGGRRVGTDFLISGFPIPDGAEIALRVGAKPALSDGAKTAPRKKTSFYKNNNTKPSGGPTADAAPVAEPEAVEEDVKLKPPPDAPALFEMAPPPRPPAEPSAKDVVAAYAESFKVAHGHEALARDRARVGREAAGLLRLQESTVAELILCAAEMGKGTFANIGTQLKIHRSGTRKASKSSSSPRPLSKDDPRWAVGAEQTRREAREILETQGTDWLEGVFA